MIIKIVLHSISRGRYYARTSSKFWYPIHFINRYFIGVRGIKNQIKNSEKKIERVVYIKSRSKGIFFAKGKIINVLAFLIPFKKAFSYKILVNKRKHTIRTLIRRKKLFVGICIKSCLVHLISMDRVSSNIF